MTCMYWLVTSRLITLGTVVHTLAWCISPRYMTPLEFDILSTNSICTFLAICKYVWCMYIVCVFISFSQSRAVISLKVNIQSILVISKEDVKPNYWKPKRASIRYMIYVVGYFFPKKRMITHTRYTAIIENVGMYSCSWLHTSIWNCVLQIYIL